MRCPYRKVRASFLLCKIISSLALSVIAYAMPPCSPSGTSCPPPPAGGVCQRERPWHGGKVSGSIAKCAEELKASPGRGSLSKRDVLAVRADFIFLPRALPLGELPSGARLRGLALPPLRRRFHRKQARHPPLAVQAPSVKMQCRAVRRPPGIALLKLFFRYSCPKRTRRTF